MKKSLLIIIGGILVVLVVVILSREAQAPEAGVDNEPDVSASVYDVLIYNGTITEVDTSKVPVDGPVEITLKTQSGDIRTILVPSFGFGLCPKLVKEAIVDPYTLKAGDAVAARGEVNERGAMVLCGTPGDYLRLQQ